MNRRFPRLLRRFAGGAVVAAALGLTSSTAFAEDEGTDAGADAIEKEIREQMEKVIRLMRENEKAILEASLGSGKRPGGVDVKPPIAPEDPSAMSEGTPPPAGMADDGAPAGGDATRRAIEEMIRTTESTGGSIPGQIEELVKLIPT